MLEVSDHREEDTVKKLISTLCLTTLLLSRGVASAAQATTVDAEIQAAQENVQQLRDQWEKQVGPRRDALRVAAETHYKVIQELRARQQKLIDAADRIQRTIDELEKSYQDLTTPRPETK